MKSTAFRHFDQKIEIFFGVRSSKLVYIGTRAPFEKKLVRPKIDVRKEGETLVGYGVESLIGNSRPLP